MKNRRKTDAPPDREATLLDVYEAIDRAHVAAIEQCMAVVLKYFGNDYSGVKCLAELEKLK